MGTRRILDAHGGVVSTLEVADDKIIVGHTQDVDAIMENNARMRQENDGFSPSRELHRVANIPVGVLTGWLQDAGIDVLSYIRNPKVYSKWLRKKIYDPENSAWLSSVHSRTAKTMFHGADFVDNARKGGAL